MGWVRSAFWSWTAHLAAVFDDLWEAQWPGSQYPRPKTPTLRPMGVPMGAQMGAQMVAPMGEIGEHNLGDLLVFVFLLFVSWVLLGFNYSKMAL